MSKMSIDDLLDAFRHWDFSAGGPFNSLDRAKRCMMRAVEVIEDLRAETTVYRDPTRSGCRCKSCQDLPVHPDDRPSTEDLCLICWKPKPAGGWHFVGESDEGSEYFCSEVCFEENRK